MMRTEYFMVSPLGLASAIAFGAILIETISNPTIPSWTMFVLTLFCLRGDILQATRAGNYRRNYGLWRLQSDTETTMSGKGDEEDRAS